MLQSFDHVGMISSYLDQTMTFYCGLLVLKKPLVKLTSEGERIAFPDACGLMLEVIEPLGRR